MKPLSIYIDTNVLNDIAPPGKGWESTSWGQYLLQESKAGNVEVWASPGNVMEIALNKDLDHRQNMATALNTLIKGQRMMPAKEFHIVDDFLSLIEINWNGVVSRDRLKFLKANSSRVYIALLGQLSALKDYDCSGGFMGILGPKIGTQLIHDQILENPKEELEKRVEAIKRQEYSHGNYFKEYGASSLEELEKKKEELRSKSFDTDKSAISYLQKNQDLLVNGYSLDDLSFSCNQVFTYWEDLVSIIIDFKKIVLDWSSQSPIEQSKNLSVKPLDPQLVGRFQGDTATATDFRTVLSQLIHRFHPQVKFPQISNYIILKDLEKGLKQGKIPTGGVVLDATHAIGALYCDILLSRDNRLNQSMQHWFKQIRKDAGLFRETAKDLKELMRSIKKGLKQKSTEL